MQVVQVVQALTRLRFCAPSQLAQVVDVLEPQLDGLPPNQAPARACRRQVCPLELSFARFFNVCI